MDNEIVKTKIGKFSCTIFRDLLFKYLAKDFFINASEEEVKQLLTKYGAKPDNIPSPFVALLLEQDNKKILIDTGIGFMENPTNFRGHSYQFKGRLHQLLEKEKIKKEDITDVIITHFHPDHIGGIYNESGTLNFPNARFYMHADEWDYWHSSQSANQPPMFGLFIEKHITPLKNLNLHFAKGITAIKVDGHTPGQIALDIHSKKEHLLYISDAFLHPLHIERLDWKTNYDLEHEKAKQSRIRLLEMAYKKNMLVNAFHFDFPGLGRVDKLKNQWVWNYTNK
jgi:glyoxylase-like metal-dependent hydrolase (beta-lactamase superfamily II)